MDRAINMAITGPRSILESNLSFDLIHFVYLGIFCLCVFYVFLIYFDQIVDALTKHKSKYKGIKNNNHKGIRRTSNTKFIIGIIILVIVLIIIKIKG